MDQKKIRITVAPSLANKRLDVFLAENYPTQTSRSHVKKLIDDGCVFVDGISAKAHRKLKGRETIIVDLSREDLFTGLVPEKIPVKIIYEDDNLLVVNKPAGMAVHPSPGIHSGTLVNALLYHCKKLPEAGSAERPGIVHRLDKDTSGLMVVAKEAGAHRNLVDQFKERKIKKKYTAFIKGHLEMDEGKIELPIGRHPSHRQKQTVRFSESREALTFYKQVRRFKDSSMVELIPKTGRMHQLRVHLSYLGHPILGDAVYGSKSKLIERQALHAATLGFGHPTNRRYLEFNAQMPQDMKRLLALL